MIGDEGVEFGGEAAELVFGAEAVGASLAVAVLDLLKESGEADFDKFVEVAGGNGEEFDALEQRIGFVLSFFKNAAIEGEPRLVPVEIVARIVECNAGHGEQDLAGKDGSASLLMECYSWGYKRTGFWSKKKRAVQNVLHSPGWSLKLKSSRVPFPGHGSLSTGNGTGLPAERARALVAGLMPVSGGQVTPG